MAPVAPVRPRSTAWEWRESPGAAEADTSGRGRGPGAFGALPGAVRVREWPGRAAAADLQDQVVVGAGGHVRGRRARLPSTRWAWVGAPDQRKCRSPVRPAQVPSALRLHDHRAGAELGAAVELDLDVRVAARGLDPAEQDDPVGVAGEGERLAALDDGPVATQRLRQIRLSVS